MSAVESPDKQPHTHTHTHLSTVWPIHITASLDKLSDSDCLSLSVHPDLVSFPNNREKLRRWHVLSECVTCVCLCVCLCVCVCVCVHQTVSCYRSQQHLYATTRGNSSCDVSWELFCIDVQREAAELHVGEADGGVDGDRAWIRVHSVRMHREALSSAPFLFLLAHRQSVWDLVWSASVPSLQSPSNAADTQRQRRGREIQGFYPVEQSNNPPGKNPYTEVLPLPRVQCVNKHAQWLMSVL